MYRAKENSEDDEEAARKDLEEAGMKKGDLLIGLAASGQTPYVLSGMKKAKEEGALTISISCVEEDKIGEYADILIRLAARKSSRDPLALKLEPLKKWF